MGPLVVVTAVPTVVPPILLLLVLLLMVRKSGRNRHRKTNSISNCFVYFRVLNQILASSSCEGTETGTVSENLARLFWPVRAIFTF